MKIQKLVSLATNLVKHRRAVVQFLTFNEHANQGFAGSVHGEELTYLLSLIRRANDIPGPVIEVGTLYGFTTQSLALDKDPEKKLVTIDNFRWNPLGMSSDAHRDFTLRALNYMRERANTEVYVGANTDYYRDYAGPTPSMTFIDAGHSYEDVMVDINWAREQKIPIISGHDYSESLPGVVKAVDESFGDQIKVVGTVWSHVAADYE